MKHNKAYIVLTLLAVLFTLLRFNAKHSSTALMEELRKSEISDIYRGNDETLFPFISNKLTNCDLLFKNQKLVDLELPEFYNKTLLELNKVLKPYKGHIEGCSASVKEITQTYQTLANMKTIRTVCETGFNAGHSSLLFLSAKSDIHMYSFDLGFHGYSKPIAELLQKRFPGRLHVTWGNSTETLMTFPKANPDIQCDIVIVDGGHTYDVAKADLVNFRPMMKKESNILIIDDHPCEADWCVPVREAWEEQLKKKIVMENFRCMSHSKKHRGFTIGKYLNL